MSDITFSEPPAYSWVTCVGQVRLLEPSGKLQQLWRVVHYDAKGQPTGHSDEWRDVPTVTE